MEHETQGTFVVELQRVTWTLSASSPTSAVDGDGATDESIPLWAAVTVVHKNGPLLDKVWFAGGGDNTLTKSFHLPSQHAVDSARGDAGETDDEMTVRLQYHQCSKTLPLTKDMLETLLGAQVQISVYRDTSRPTTTDELLGEVRIPIRAIVHELAVDVCIQIDVDLADFASGYRVLRIHSLALVNLPKEWTLPCANDDEAIQICVAPERNLATYGLEIRLPDLATRAITVPPATANNKDTSGDPSASAPQLTGTWSVAFPPTAEITKLFPKTAVDRLAEFIHVDKHIGATLRRTYVEGAAKLPEVLTANARIHLSDLVRPGTARMLARVKVSKVIPVAKESIEQDFAAAVSNDEKKKIQAALADYESVVHQAASISNALSISGTHVESIIEVLSSTLLIFKLNTQGAYHNFKETLEKRIIPVIRDRFARSELISDGDADGLDEEEREHPNGTRHKNDLDALEKASASMQDKPSEKEMAAVLDALKLKAMENEVNGDAEKSETIHLDRIAYAEEHAFLSRDDHNQHHQAHHQSAAHPSPYALESVWYDYARFSLIQGDVERAGTNFRQCLSLNARSLPALIGYTALLCELLCELRDFVHVEHFGKSTVTLALAAYSASTFAGVTKTIWTDVVLAHALLAFYFVQSGKDPTGNLTLFELLKAQQILQYDGGEPCKNARLASVWIFLVEYTNELKLREMTQLGLELADSFRKPRNVLSAQERVVKRALEAESRLAAGDSDHAIKLLHDALEIEPSHPFAWLILGKAYLQQKENQTETAIECLQRALENHTLLRTDDLRLGLYVHLGIVLLQASQFGIAETVFLQACDEFRVASNWLDVGIASLRMEKWELAHMAFAEANRLDVSNPDVWGYLALFALTSSPKITARQETEAKRFVQQALRYNLSNPVLLRELSNGFVAIGRLEDTEKSL
ncbi:Tetratricopeptide repeat-containing domain, partial [Globisporangium splendens]